MNQAVRRLWIEEEGQDLSEYALILLLVSLVAVTAVGRFESSVFNLYANSSARVVAIAHHQAAASHLSGAAGSAEGAHLSGHSYHGIINMQHFHSRKQ